MHLDDLSEKKWTLIPIDQQLCLALHKCAITRLQMHQFRQAGLAAVQNVNDASLKIRNDEIFWLDAKAHELSDIETQTLAFLDNLRLEIKENLRVSLTEFECHFAFYDKGHYYQKHRDTTSANNKRVFSFVLYLNENWQDSDGGQLIGYEQQEVLFQIKPAIGNLILFRSDLEHEVMSTFRGRFSLTGWFRK